MAAAAAVAVAAAVQGAFVRIDARVLKAGSRLGFTQVDVYRSADDVLIASGRHTKSLS
jgi:acyl-coenzyme A thioesterase PaaI-like protein